MVALLCLLISVIGQTIHAHSFDILRSALADLDGDGNVEVILGGRLGAHRSVGGARGLLQIGEIRAGYVRILAEGGRGGVIRDVAIGDYGRNGRLDVFAVRDGLLQVYAYENSRLVPIGEQSLGSEWTDRVAVLTGARETLVAVTEYSVPPDRDVGVTTVRGFRVSGGNFAEVWSLRIDAHVGDLTLLGGESNYLILETGAGDEGGDVIVFALSGGTNAPSVVWSGRVTDGRRCFTLEAATSNGILVQPIGDDAHLFSLRHGELQLERRMIDTRGGRVMSRVSRSGEGVSVGLLGPGANGFFRPLTF